MGCRIRACDLALKTRLYFNHSLSTFHILCHKATPSAPVIWVRNSHCTSEKWTMAMERNLLTYYRERVYRFNNDHVDNSILWKEIVQVSSIVDFLDIYILSTIVWWQTSKFKVNKNISCVLPPNLATWFSLSGNLHSAAILKIMKIKILALLRQKITINAFVMLCPYWE